MSEGWTLEHAEVEAVDENGWSVSRPAGWSRFTCADHGFDTGYVKEPKARDRGRVHLQTLHIGDHT